MKNIVNRFYYWGREKKSLLFSKWYDDFFGISLFKRHFIGFDISTGCVVNKIDRTPEFKFHSIKYITVYIILFYYSLEFNLLTKKKFNKIKYIKRNNEDDTKWYCGYTGIKLFGIKTLGFSISDNVYDNERHVWIFMYIFTHIISFDVIGKIDR